ncbi:hypothetical protein KK062_26150 [Fulvivirgaceae bacterium PWU5]|uniref:Lipoprotein n=1 Tax=Dawidia cretensis TaxID=2782350 RepID=A0AAP2E2F6_9BACT|nr:hypothetical protein [Dawidia cretensis]MBT1711751.1 hypothetical protein [Dawidia cretensis]
MKQTIFILFLSCLTFYACHSQDKKKGVVAPDPTHVDGKNTRLTEQDMENLRKKSIGISLDEALTDISNLLKNPDPSLQKLAGHAIGGIFCVKDFFPPAASDTLGVLMWYCLNETTQPTTYPKFFLSIEQIGERQVDSTLTPTRKVLQLPSRSYPYEGRGKDTAAVHAFLKKLDDIPACTTGLTNVFPNIPTQQTYITEYRNYVRVNPNTRGREHTDMDWAYFQNNIDSVVNKKTLTHLITQAPDIRYIRYFFGYNSGKQGLNTIRVILFAVDDKGRTITQINDKGKAKDAYIVQKSIPPVGLLSTSR